MGSTAGREIVRGILSPSSASAGNAPLQGNRHGSGHQGKNRRWFARRRRDWARAARRRSPGKASNLVITARGKEALEATAAEIRKASGVKVTAVAGDITTPEGRAAALAACPSPDILVNNAGGPPPGDFRNWSREDWIKALDANMLTPIELIKATVDGMIARKFGRIVNITSGAVKMPIPELGLSNGARTGLTGFVAGIARQTVAHNVTINGLLPGPFDTDRLRGNLKFNAQKLGKTEKRSWRQVRMQAQSR